MSRFYSLLAVLLLGAAPLLAQPEGESPYSAANEDRAPGDWWSTNGLVIVCAVIFFGLILFLVFRGRRRA